MAAAITHNIDAVVRGLTTYQRTNLPRAARRTVNLLGFQIARKDVPRYMKEVFENPNSFTLRSLTYKVVSNYEVHLSFKQNVPKGNDPARYLYPVTKGLSGNQAYATKFTRFLQSSGAASKSEYPIPVKENLNKNAYGKVSQGEYSKAWSGLTTSLPRSRTKSQLDPSLSFGGQKRRLVGFNRNNNFRYFSKNNAGQVFMGGAIQPPPSKGSLFGKVGAGVYRLKGDDLQLLFTYAKQQPRVPKIFDYYGFVEKQVGFRAAPILREALR
jgi:hypothetical protein